MDNTADSGQSKQISARKLAANRNNAQKSTGPRDTSLTRYNAGTHGLLAQGITELDGPDRYRSLCSLLKRQLNPIGELETALVCRIAFCQIRLDRAALLEAEFITERLHPPVTRTTYPPPDPGVTQIIEMVDRMNGTTVVLDPGLPARLSAFDVDPLLTFQRYETAIQNKLYRALNQLERLQRIRRGDKIPAPAAVDVNVHREGEGVAPFGNSQRS
jgi:hypothetical protein